MPDSRWQGSSHPQPTHGKDKRASTPKPQEPHNIFSNNKNSRAPLITALCLGTGVYGMCHSLEIPCFRIKIFHCHKILFRVLFGRYARAGIMYCGARLRQIESTQPAARNTLKKRGRYVVGTYFFRPTVRATAAAASRDATTTDPHPSPNAGCSPKAERADEQERPHCLSTFLCVAAE